MKKIAFITIALLGIILGVKNYSNNTYQKTMTIVETSDNMVTCEDKDGYLWEFETENKDVENATEILITFDDNQTENIFDDKITNYEIIK